MQELVVTTEKNLNAQKELLTALLKLKRTRAAFVEEPTSRKYATELVKAAVLVETKIEEEHLAHLFSSDFLTELHFFNQVGKQAKP